MKRRLQVLMGVLVAGALATGVAVAASSPSVTTGGHSNIKDASAVVSGTVNPNGTATSYVFRWGVTNGYGDQTAERSAGSGTTAVSVKATITGLTPGTTYHYQLLATNKYGSTAGADRTFTTAGHPPAGVITGPATQVGTNFGNVTGVLNPNGEATTWQFQYGPTTSYGSTTFGGTTPATTSAVPVSSTIQGLASGTVFHYRLVAQHGSVTSVGQDQMFMTYPSPRPVAGLHSRTQPHRDRSKPFTYTTTGGITGPTWMPAQFTCSGQVTVRAFLGGRRVSLDVAPVAPNCTFSVQTQFNRKPGRGPANRVVRLNVFVRYQGTGYLAPSKPHKLTITLG